MTPWLAQARSEIKLALTQGESLLVTVGIPVLLLVGFTSIKVLPLPHGVSSRAGFLVPGTIALAIMSTGLVSQGIATAVDRSYGVLKRLGATPLGRSGLLFAKFAAIATVEVIQIVVLMAVGLILGWTPHGNPALFVVGLILSSLAFTGVGMTLAGTLKSEAMIGLANGIYLVLLFLGGMIFPASSLPGVVEDVAKVLPALPTAQIFLHGIGIGGSIGIESWIALLIWAILAPLAAIKFFRWE